MPRRSTATNRRGCRRAAASTASSPDLSDLPCPRLPRHLALRLTRDRVTELTRVLEILLCARVVTGGGACGRAQAPPLRRGIRGDDRVEIRERQKDLEHACQLGDAVADR